MQVERLRGIEKFEGEIENFIFNRPTFIYFKPVKRFENRSGVSEFRSFNNGTSQGVLVDSKIMKKVKLGFIIVRFKP